MQYIDGAIVKLINASAGLAFTGYITEAQLHRKWALEGEVWRHQRAAPSGEFADGHRIQTSDLDEVHIAGDCVWVVTANKSRYGVISFSLEGWRWLDDLIRNGDDRPFCPLLVDHDEVGAGVQPTPDGEAYTWHPKTKLKTKRERAPETANAGHHRFRPPPQPSYLEDIQSHFEKSIAALRRNGMVSTRAQDAKTLQELGGDQHEGAPDSPDPLPNSKSGPVEGK